MATTPFTRLHVNLAHDTMDVLKGLCARHGLSLTEGVRRMVAIWQFITTEMDAGNKLAVVKMVDGEIVEAREVVML